MERAQWIEEVVQKWQQPTLSRAFNQWAQHTAWASRMKVGLFQRAGWPLGGSLVVLEWRLDGIWETSRWQLDGI